MSEGEGVIIRQDSLIHRFWNTPSIDESGNFIGKGSYCEKDVTNLLPSFLSERCWIEGGTTLRDIFKLCKKHKEFLSKLQYRNFFKEYLDYGLRTPIRDLSAIENPDELKIDYLEIYVWLEHQLSCTSSEDKILEYKIYETGTKVRHKYISTGEEFFENTSLSIGFHGKSSPLTKKCSKKYGYSEKNIGKIVDVGFFGSNIAEYIDLPVKINTSIQFNEWNMCSGSRLEKTKELKNYNSLTLFNIIDTIFYEISFHGSIEDTKKTSSEIYNQIEKIKTEEEYE